MEDKALSPEQAAPLLGVKVGTLAAWRYRCQGPKYHKMGNAIRYYLSDIEAFKASVAVDPCPVLPPAPPHPPASLPAWLQNTRAKAQVTGGQS